MFLFFCILRWLPVEKLQRYVVYAGQSKSSPNGGTELQRYVIRQRLANHLQRRTFARAHTDTDRQTHTHTHTLAPSILSLLQALAEGLFWNLPDFGGPVKSDVLHCCETCPLEAHFQSREQPKVIRSEIRRVRWLGDDTPSIVWLGALPWCRNHCPCMPLVEPLPPKWIAQPMQNLHVEITSSTLSGRY
jgi:hypothetical protein